MKYLYPRTRLAGLFILLISATGFKADAPATSQPSETAPSPQLVISLERQTLRENDRLPIRVLLSNTSDNNLANVTLAWAALPGSLVLYPQSCADAPKEPAIDTPPAQLAFGTVPARRDAGAVQIREICLTSTTVTNGDYTLLFDLRYDWTGKEGPKHSVLTVEKPIKSAFLGTDSLAGVPLALAGFIVPGLLFWLALDFWKTPWRIQGPTLGDKTVYSILVSLLLVALVSVFPRLKEDVDITRGLNFQKLEYLALLGGVAGMLIGAGDRWLRAILTRRALQTSDDEYTLLVKLLRLNPGVSKPQTTVTLTDGQVFQGSVGGQSTSHTFLAGWYKISRDNKNKRATDEIQKEIEKLIAAGDWALAAELALKYGYKFGTQDFIYRKGADGAFATSDPARMTMQWENSLVQGKPKVEVQTDREQPIQMN